MQLHWRSIVKRGSFVSIPEQFIGNNEILNQLNKVLKSLVTDDTQEQLEQELLVCN
ncbi:hypothetical protein [Bacillus cereus]|uniref:hypothetical protein n=1 Tax=Bacillus cereus TaxID=1396 RepID=UPI0015CF1482|nr:hypothetical protein [Bacillus cereus]